MSLDSDWDSRSMDSHPSDFNDGAEAILMNTSIEIEIPTGDDQSRGSTPESHKDCHEYYVYGQGAPVYSCGCYRYREMERYKVLKLSPPDLEQALESGDGDFEDVNGLGLKRKIRNENDRHYQHVSSIRARHETPAIKTQEPQQAIQIVRRGTDSIPRLKKRILYYETLQNDEHLGGSVLHQLLGPGDYIYLHNCAFAIHPSNAYKTSMSAYSLVPPSNGSLFSTNFRQTPYFGHATLNKFAPGEGKEMHCCEGAGVEIGIGVEMGVGVEWGFSQASVRLHW
ncbi:uncharacterized protein F5891DRAFT_983766 [Suillus fuscotomentosus]|uniref:Uncharacterized protein n=1 Tax=Suillus fuscotomentosus TaxID=1912939 RepID=A0AAD4DXQ2_9AGAM|nr:uncharacterized protein F5891DRAFT_983766 [Suillus fuscotomentosus]KAG1896063.1 hypothetical protein F5891DRAFT_983766 [Suillus fuscotomentosus]